MECTPLIGSSAELRCILLSFLRREDIHNMSFASATWHWLLSDSRLLLSDTRMWLQAVAERVAAARDTS